MEYKTITMFHKDEFIDMAMLYKGLYVCNYPSIWKLNTTRAAVLKVYRDQMGKDSEGYKNVKANFKHCKLRKIEVKFI